MTVSAWRIAAPEFSNNIVQMMSGEGAFLYGGRWNSKGTRVVYLGSSIAQAAMELLVHLGRSDILRKFHLLDVLFEEEHIAHIALDDLPGDWAEETMVPETQYVGDYWVEEKTSLILQVPSVAVIGEYNYLLNPSHPQMDEVNFGNIRPFDFDPRIIK